MSGLIDAFHSRGKYTAAPQIDIIVTRHRGLIDWLATNLIPHEYTPRFTGTALEWWTFGLEPQDPEYGCYRSIPVVWHGTAEDVRGKHVVGVLPLHLACLAASVTEVALPDLRPDQRGKEVTPDEMDAAGARLVRYTVLTDAEREGARLGVEAGMFAGVPFDNTPDGGAAVVLAVSQKLK